MVTGICARLAVRLPRPNLDVAEVAAVRERDVQVRELTPVVQVSGVELHIGAHQPLAEHVLVERDVAEPKTLPRVEVQHDVRDALLGIDVDAVLVELRVGVTAFESEIGPTALQCLVVTVVQRPTFAQRRLAARRQERRVICRLTLERDVDAAHGDGLTGFHGERRVPADSIALELGIDTRLVVAERL